MIFFRRPEIYGKKGMLQKDIQFPLYKQNVFRFTIYVNRKFTLFTEKFSAWSYFRNRYFSKKMETFILKQLSKKSSKQKKVQRNKKVLSLKKWTNVWRFKLEVKKKFMILFICMFTKEFSLGCKNIRIRKFDFVAKTQFLSRLNDYITFTF